MTVARAIRVAACADYLLNVPIKEISYRHGIAGHSIMRWLHKVPQFKLRGKRGYALPLVGGCK